MRRYANKKDLNHDAVLVELARLGIWWRDADLCTGMDLLCCYQGWFFLLEIKSNRGRLTARQIAIINQLEYLKAPYIVHREGQDLEQSILDLHHQHLRQARSPTS